MPPVTLTIPVTPGQIVTGVLPSVDAMQVESVYATIDASGGGPVTPELLIADPSGQVIATKRQSDSIPAGDTGSATWALRLGADGGAAAAGATPSGFYTLGPTVVASGTTTPLIFAADFGDALLDLAVPDTPQIIAAGTYLLRATVFRNVLAGFAGKVEQARIAMNVNYGAAETVAGAVAPMDAVPEQIVLSPALPWVAAAGTFFQVGIDHNAGVNRTYVGALNIVKIA